MKISHDTKDRIKTEEIDSIFGTNKTIRVIKGVLRNFFGQANSSLPSPLTSYRKTLFFSLVFISIFKTGEK